MIDSTIHGADPEALGRLCAIARTGGEPGEWEVTRLRRRVRRAVETERLAARRPAILRPLALAASLAIAVLSLTALRPAGPAGGPAAGRPLAEADVAVPVRTASGAVAFRLPEGRTVRVIRADSPRADDGPAERARGLYVDRRGGQAPGTVVFYRFD